MFCDKIKRIQLGAWILAVVYRVQSVGSHRRSLGRGALAAETAEKTSPVKHTPEM